MKINFNRPVYTGNEIDNIKQAITNQKLSGDGEFGRKCQAWLELINACRKSFLVPSGTHALELSALLMDIKEGDEVIMPSFTFPSTANAFVLRGARIVFVDIRPDTMNIDENLIGPAITEKTRAIVPVHYAGISCDMDKIIDTAKRHNLSVVEDSAQGLMASYKGRALGTIGNMGCLSFHETKNYHCGEGGALLLRDDDLIERAEIIREKGTDRQKFFRGQVDKYSWVDIGSSYLLGELNAAYLYAQLEIAQIIKNDRMDSWSRYHRLLMPLNDTGTIDLPTVPDDCQHNGHIFYIKTKDIEERGKMIKYLNDNGIMSLFHYVPLHSSVTGLKYGRFAGEDRFTTRESERLLRLPIYYGINPDDVDYVVSKIKEFYGYCQV